MPAPKSAALKTSRAGDSGKTIKLAVAIVGLLVGGALIAWNLGVFGSGADAVLTPALAEGQAGSVAPPAPVTPPRPNAIPAMGMQPELKP